VRHIPAQGFIDAFDVDFVGVVNTVHVGLPHLKSGGSVIVTGSIAGLLPATGMNGGNLQSPDGGGYGLAKKMVNGQGIHENVGTCSGTDSTWSDRRYFFAASPDGSILMASGYGNNPNSQTGLGYVKVTLADDRHWDLMAGRPVTGGERAEVGAGPLHWTCVEPLKKWKLEVDQNNSGIAWELHYEPTAPMWELLPVNVRVKDGKFIADM